jgi:hypothetical protein
MVPREETELINACRILFGTHVDVTPEFLRYIQPDGIKNAYRSRARECHPDSYLGEGDLLERTELFRRSVEAYELLTGFLRDRKLPATRPKTSSPGYRSPACHRWPRPRTMQPRARDERYYDGPLPPIELRVGLFLYFRGIISYQAVVRSLLWQRDQRPALGVLACNWGWITDDLIDYLLSACHMPAPFGERAVKLGLLTRNQLKILLFHQRSLQQPIGRYFVQQGLISEQALLQHLKERIHHNKEVKANRLL